MAEQTRPQFVDAVEEIQQVFLKFALRTCRDEEKESKKWNSILGKFTKVAFIFVLFSLFMDYLQKHNLDPQLTGVKYFTVSLPETFNLSLFVVTIIVTFPVVVKTRRFIERKDRRVHRTLPKNPLLPFYNYLVGEKYIPSLKRDLKQRVDKWAGVMPSVADRLAACVALCNGCALYGVPRDACDELLQYACPQDTDLLCRFADLAYDQTAVVEPEAVAHPEAILQAFKDKDVETCPHIVSLYLFAAALARYFPEETDQEMRALAQRCYHRVPPSYQSFMTGEIALQDPYPFLLPQLRQVASEKTFSEALDHSDYRQRLKHLYLPLDVYYSKDPYSNLTTKLLNTVLSKEELARLGDSSVYSLQGMIRHFAHTYGNLDTRTLEQVTAELLARDDPELRGYAHKLIAETQTKKDLLVGIKLMHLRCREDRGELQDRLRNSIALADAETAVSVEDLFDAALRVCLYHIMYNINDKKADIGRRRLPSHLPDGTYRRVDFENKVIVGKQRCIDWLRETSPFIHFELDIADSWQEVRLYNESFAAVLWEYLLGELAFNALKYGDIEKPIRFAFRSKGASMSVIAENALPAQEEDHIRGEGLAGQKETLNFLTGQDDCLTQEVTDTDFRVKVTVPRSQLLP